MGTVSNILVEPCSVTFNGSDLGFVEGDIDIALDEKTVEITAHQEGTNVLDAIRTGKNVEVTLGLKETSLTQVQTALGWGGSSSSAAAEVSTVTTVADSSASLNNKYFFIRTGANALYHVWFNVSSGGSDPAPSGSTAIAVAISTNATAAQVASAVQSAVDATAPFIATVSNNVVTITNAATGQATDISDVNTSFTFAVTTQGGASGLYGWGSSKDFTAVSTQAAKLVLHPVALSSSDKTRDLNFWKAYPMLESINLSGENPRVIKVKFKVFPDTTRQSAIRLFAIGDGS